MLPCSQMSGVYLKAFWQFCTNQMQGVSVRIDKSVINRLSRADGLLSCIGCNKTTHSSIDGVTEFWFSEVIILVVFLSEYFIADNTI